MDFTPGLRAFSWLADILSTSAHRLAGRNARPVKNNQP